MTRPQVVFRGNAVLIEVRNLKDALTGAAITDALIYATMYDEDGTTELSGTTWPKIMAHNGSGNYSVVASPTIPSASETGRVLIVSSDPYPLEFDFTVDFLERGEVY